MERRGRDRSAVRRGHLALPRGAAPAVLPQTPGLPVSTASLRPCRPRLRQHITYERGRCRGAGGRGLHQRRTTACGVGCSSSKIPRPFLSPRLLPIPVRGPALLSAHSSFFLANSHSCPSAAVQRPLQLPRLLLRGDLGASPSASGPVCSPTKCFPPSENFCPRVHLTRSPSQGVLLRETEDLPLRIHLPARGKAQVTATTCLETAALPPSWALYENGGLSSVKW